MNIARYHADWLNLVENTGPFLSLPVLKDAFPQGLDEFSTPERRAFREQYEVYCEHRQKKGVSHHQAWIRYVLTTLLEYPEKLLTERQDMPAGMEAVKPRFHETLRPSFALKHSDDGKKPVLLISVYAPEVNLDKPLPERGWKASPGTRMMELLHETGITTGLITNGEEWMLVFARPGEATGFATWSADLWMQEPATLLAFRSLLHLRRFFGVDETKTLSALLLASSQDQHEVTDQLGYQVRQAVEVLVQSIDNLGTDAERALLADVDNATLYSASLTVMMRLVFLFAAEERGMLLLGQNEIYDTYYALSTLRDILRSQADQHGEEVLERRSDAWCRLLATFRAIHGGVEHANMRMPAYGGSLFDPDRYPFLEGRTSGTTWRTAQARPLSINNRVVLHLLEALQLLRVKLPGGGPKETRRLSFHALDIEQIGHVYEGLLDHTVKRASETILGLAGSKNKEPEIALSKLEELAEKIPSDLGGKLFTAASELVQFLKEETGRNEKALANALNTADPELDGYLQLLCNHDIDLYGRLRPFVGLIRKDSFDQLVVIRSGSRYVTSGSDRRSSGTHYTPRSLTEPIVQHTLEPLVYVGPAEGKPESEWQLKSPKEILDLHVCDLAMGSAAFLVQVCRYLSERLVEAWEVLEQKQPADSFLVTPEGEISTGSHAERLLPLDSGERLAIARRIIVDRCLYGVDINPMAVEMAKLSMWLITLQKDRPFTFLDHAFKCGDSLLGVTSLKQIENFSLRVKEGDIVEDTFSIANLFSFVKDAATKRLVLENMPSNDRAQIEAKKRLHTEAEAATAKVKALADCLIAFELQGVSAKHYKEQRAEASRQAEAAMLTSLTNFLSYANDKLHGRRTFQWALEFPEVFERGGFDAFVGNPPFIGGHDISGLFGYDYRELLTTCLYGAKAGLADICAFFAVRCLSLSRVGSTLGLVATNSITEGDSRKVGLDKIVSKGGHIVHAWPDMPWPGVAAVVVSPFIVFNGKWKGVTYSTTLTLTPHLAPHPLANNQNRCFVGCYILGDYFLLPEAMAKMFLKETNMASDVVLPYINGVELNSIPNGEPRRWIACFWDWNKSKAQQYKSVFDYLQTSYLNSVHDEKSMNSQHKWWLYARCRSALYHAIGLGCRFEEHPLEWLENKVIPHKTIVKAKTSETWAFAIMSSATIFDQALTVFSSDDNGLFAVLQSTIHEIWARESGAGSKMKTDLRYAPTTFEAFPLPAPNTQLIELGRSYETFRSEVMLKRNEGLTSIYNRFHNRSEMSVDVARLRALHEEMDKAVAAAYGWNDLDLGHGFHETKQGIRYTISETARRKVLDLLLKLNHERYAEEVKAGLHDKKKSAAGSKRDKKEKQPVAVSESGVPYVTQELSL